MAILTGRPILETEVLRDFLRAYYEAALVRPSPLILFTKRMAQVACLGQFVPLVPFECLRRKRTICIVGAGVAGLCCAEQLARSDQSSNLEIVVVEARDRVGGRVWTPDMRTCSSSHASQCPRVNLGASWIHGKRAAEAFENGGSMLDRLRRTRWRDTKFDNRHGQRIPETAAAEASERFEMLLDKSIRDVQLSTRPDKDLPGSDRPWLKRYDDGYGTVDLKRCLPPRRQ